MSTEPHKFGDYMMVEQIAVGGMAEVWRARATGLAGFEKVVVIKKILPALAQDEEFIRLFIDEAKILTNLVHTNIVQVFELNKASGVHYITLEHVNGLDLARVVSRSKTRGAFPISLGLFLVTEVLKALAFAHTRLGDDGQPLHIVHCDVSPQNVLVSQAGEVKLTDFGISRCAFQVRGLHDVVRGKYAYMSPEQVDGHELDGRSDLFSLAIVLYELLTGRRLFKAQSRDETVARVRRCEVPSPRGFRPEISEDLEALLLRALAPRPEDRFPDAATMLDELGALWVREGHRATHADLAAFVREVSGEGPPPTRVQPPTPKGVIVLAAEATAPPRTMAGPKSGQAGVLNAWTGLLAESGAILWEAGENSVLAVWTAEDIGPLLPRAVDVAAALRDTARQAGFRCSAGLAPGVARFDAGSGRPPDGWELAGPFYLARWLMNLSAHSGRPLLTDVGARTAPGRTRWLGRISILGNRTIRVAELI